MTGSAPLGLLDDLALAFYDPADGSGLSFGMPREAMSRRLHTFAAAALLDQFADGSLVVAGAPDTAGGVPAHLAGRTRAAPGGEVVAGTTPPEHPALLKGWTRVRHSARPTGIDAALRRAVVGDPEQRLLDRGLVDEPRRGPRVLTPAGLAEARQLRAPLDGFVQAGLPGAELPDRARRLGALVAAGELEPLVFRGPATPDPEPARARLSELSALEEGRDGSGSWRITVRALRRINAPFVH
jgi:hypothetical protein